MLSTVPGGRHVAGDRLLGQRHHELRVVPGVGVVLRDLEPELLLAAGLVTLQQVQGPGIRAGDLAQLAQDVVKELVVVPLRREGDSDLEKLGVLGLFGLEEPVLLRELSFQVEPAKKVPQRALEVLGPGEEKTSSYRSSSGRAPSGAGAFPPGFHSRTDPASTFVSHNALPFSCRKPLSTSQATRSPLSCEPADMRRTRRTATPLSFCTTAGSSGTPSATFRTSFGTETPFSPLLIV